MFWEVAQSSCNACHVLAHSSWEVAQSSYDVCHVSDQSSWEVVQISYDVFFLLIRCYLFRMLDDIKIRNLAKT